MPYVRQTWQTGPLGGTPLSAERLNYMEAGIAEASNPESGIAVIIGNSHSAPDTAMWHTDVGAAMGWEIKNFAISGTGFVTGTTTTRYSGQVTTSNSSLTTAEKARVRAVFVVDASNDIRSSPTAAQIATAASSLFSQIRSAYPTARIILIPALWGTQAGTTNETADAKTALTATLISLRESAITSRVEYVEWSWTWNWGRSDLMQTNDIHYTAAGKAWIAGWVIAYLRGSDTRYDQPWTAPANESQIANEGVNGLGPLRVRREGSQVIVLGRFWNIPTLNGTITTLPEGMRPIYNTNIEAVLTGTWARYTLLVTTTGLVQTFSAPLPPPGSNQGYIINDNFQVI